MLNGCASGKRRFSSTSRFQLPCSRTRLRSVKQQRGLGAAHPGFTMCEAIWYGAQTSFTGARRIGEGTCGWAA